MRILIHLPIYLSTWKQVSPIIEATTQTLDGNTLLIYPVPLAVRALVFSFYFFFFEHKEGEKLDGEKAGGGGGVKC